MKRIPGLFLFCMLFALVPSGAAATNLVNDGTTAVGLERLANEFNFLGFADTTLATNAGGFLTAAQSGQAIPPMRTVWYSLEAVPTNRVYRVGADFRPAAASPLHRGGVMGWLDVVARKGIALKIDPAPPATLQVSVVNFATESPEENESVTNLYNLEGTPAVTELGSAWADLTASYAATSFAALELDFTAPSVADLAALSNVTAHITAKLLQSSEGTNPPVPLGETIELLTDLPLPDAVNHRFGYFAVWANFGDGGVIGDLDNLTASGGVARPPVVNLVSPTADAQYLAPATIPIQADARDTDGTVSKVEFFNNGFLLGSATNAPYGFAWTNVPYGSYVLTARATDNLGLRAVSSPVRITVAAPPFVALQAPADLASFAEPATLLLEANAFDLDGSVTAVDFFAGTQLLGTLANPPYQLTWSNVVKGHYPLTARATDNLGIISTSAPVTIDVTVPPSVTITSPAQGASFHEPAIILIQVDAADVDGSVVGVDFFAGDVRLGTAASAPYEFAWSPVPAGSYALTAIAQDNLGISSISAPVNVLVVGGPQDRPTMSFTMTTNGFRLSWATRGFQLQFRSSLRTGAWANWPADTTSLTGVTIPYDYFTMPSQFFQLVATGAPVQPELSIVLSTNTITVSWPSSVTGYKLQFKPTLGAATWTDITTTGNSYSEFAGAASKFFRLALQ